ncbi:MAG: nucleotidyltransferase domain-containing protein [Nitrospirae bacterium]|nr:nucleotidyltransferase domain-containing protein [Nitrospirota bacterium]
MGRAEADVRRLLRSLRTHRVERAILFGSRARGEALVDSDVDLILVSPGFEGIPFVKRIGDVLAKWRGRVGLDVLCYTPGEFRKKCREYGLVREAAREGRSLIGRRRGDGLRA